MPSTLFARDRRPSVIGHLSESEPEAGMLPLAGRCGERAGGLKAAPPASGQQASPSIFERPFPDVIPFFLLASTIQYLSLWTHTHTYTAFPVHLLSNAPIVSPPPHPSHFSHAQPPHNFLHNVRRRSPYSRCVFPPSIARAVRRCVCRRLVSPAIPAALAALYQCLQLGTARGPLSRGSSLCSCRVLEQTCWGDPCRTIICVS